MRWPIAASCDNVRGYSLSTATTAGLTRPPASSRAVAAGEVDVALAWGPLAGYFAQRQRKPLRDRAGGQPFEMPTLPMAFDISMGVRRDGGRCAHELDAALDRRRGEIDAILARIRRAAAGSAGHGGP